MIIESKFQVTTEDGFEIRGMVQAPPKHRAFLVLCHGIGGTLAESGLFDELVPPAADIGLATARFDFRGHGVSDGGPEDLTLAGEAQDLAAVVERVVDTSTPLFLVGASFGAGAVVRYAAESDRQVMGVVLLNPVLRYKETFFQPHYEWSAAIVESRKSALPAGIAARLPNSDAVISDALAAEFESDETLTLLERVSAPILLVHGTDDTKVPFEYSKMAAELPSIELVALDGAQHGFRGHRPEVVARAIAWIGRRIPR